MRNQAVEALKLSEEEETQLAIDEERGEDNAESRGSDEEPPKSTLH
jgi:hypothetical protein